MKAATENTEMKEPLRGIWVTPRLTNKDPQEKFDEEYAKVKAAGINMIYTFGEKDSNKLMDKVLAACEKNGLKVVVCMSRYTLATHLKSNLKFVEKYDSNPCIIGYNLFDEPNASDFERLAEEYEAIKEICSPDKIVMINFLPNYASDEQLGTKSGGGLSAYRNYLKKYFEVANSDVISFDAYPYRADKAGDEALLGKITRNMCDIARCGIERGLDTWGFVQCGEWAGTRSPNKEELRFLTHYHLLFGLKGYAYFLYVTPVDGVTEEGTFLGMVNYDGTERDTYYRVQETARELDGMRGVYLDYYFVGVTYANIPESWKENIAEDLYVERPDGVYSITAAENNGKILCGYFKKDDGSTGLYLLNCDTEAGVTAKVSLISNLEYKVWGAGGIEQMGRNRSIEVSLIAGEGKFIELPN